MDLAFVSTHSPRRCGLATFNGNLMTAMGIEEPNLRCRVASIDEAGVLRTTSRDVRWLIQQGDPASFSSAGEAIAASGADAVVIQHEFGLYGSWTPNGVYVNHLEKFLEKIDVPVVTTFHTVQRQPTPSMREALRYVAQRSECVVVMAETGVELLRSVYGINKSPLLVRHGVPHVEPSDHERSKRQMNLEGRKIVSTFGLVSPGKGIEYMIRALPAIAARHPEVLYLIIGQTHPSYVAQLGESYRDELTKLIEELGMSNHVQFVNRYLSEDEIVSHLLASDVCVTPYLDPEQITSGALSYALGIGKAIVSTRYLHAQEALSNNRGMLVDFRSAEQLGNAVGAVLDDPALRKRLEENAFAYGRESTWSNVSRRMLTELREITSTSSSPLREAVSVTSSMTG